MTWVADSKGKLTVWKADGKGNPNKVGDNVTSDPFAAFTNLPGMSSSGSSGIGKVDITANEYDITGLGLPATVTNGKTTMNADTFIKALQKTALTDSGAWAGIQYAMYRANYYGKTTPTFGTWDKNSDLTSIKQFMEALTLLNDDPTKPASVNTFLTDQENAAISLGGNGIRPQIAKVTVPNTLDLNYISDKAFRSALGRPPTVKESAAFAKSYQADVMAVARANAAATAPAMPKMPEAAAPQLPTIPGQTKPSIKQPTIAENFAQAQTSPTVSVVGKQDVPNADVAAAEFARQADPTMAGVEGLNSALSNWFKSLGGGGLA